MVRPDERLDRPVRPASERLRPDRPVHPLPRDGAEGVDRGVARVVAPEVLIDLVVAVEEVEEVEEVEDVLLVGDVGEGASRGDEGLDLEFVGVEEEADPRLDVVGVAAPLRRGDGVLGGVAGARLDRDDVDRRDV